MPRLLPALGLLCLATLAPAQTPGVFDVIGPTTGAPPAGGGHRPDRVIVSLSEDAPPDTLLTSTMARQLRAVLAVLDTPADVRRLYACQTHTPARNAPQAADPVRVCILHLIKGGATKRVEVLRAPDGAFIARIIADPSKPPVLIQPVRLDRRFAELLDEWPAYRGAFDPPPKTPPQPPPGSSDTLAKPYLPGRFTLDKRTLSDRFLHGHTTNIDSVTRVLADESLCVRLPRSYDPRHPAGLLVWIDAGDAGTPPEAFAPAADELGFIIIGAARAGNDRPAADRDQLAFDAVATASARYHVDPRRVYVTGISGGGRVSSMLLACFPDVFTGAVPIVGVSTYADVHLPDAKRLPAGYQKPEPKLFNLLKTRRMAAVTGPLDFNFTQITGAANLMTADGLDVRVFEYPDMGHQMPRPDRFLAALHWVDEPYDRLRDAERKAAETLLASYTKAHGDKPPADSTQCAELDRIMAAGPWTDPAWHAADLLGLSDSSAPEPKPSGSAPPPAPPP